MSQSNINLDMKALKNKYSKSINQRNISNVGTKAIQNMRKNAKINNGTNKGANNTRKNNTNTRKNKPQAEIASKESNSNGRLSSIITILLQLLLVSLIIYFIYQIYIYYDTPCIFRKDFTQFVLDGFDSPCEFRKDPPKPNPLIGKKEVFNISNQKYTYEQAKCKCKAYGGELASYNQIVKAYNKGAEWCNYGWSKGQKAYYPTQACPHKRKKDHCGKPGINGGNFPAEMKFGVNCYGIKPKGEIVRKITPKCKVKDNFCKLPKNYAAASKLDNDDISPFNPDKYHE